MRIPKINKVYVHLNKNPFEEDSKVYVRDVIGDYVSYSFIYDDNSISEYKHSASLSTFNMVYATEEEELDKAIDAIQGDIDKIEQDISNALEEEEEKVSPIVIRVPEVEPIFKPKKLFSLGRFSLWMDKE